MEENNGSILGDLFGVKTNNTFEFGESTFILIGVIIAGIVFLMYAKKKLGVKKII